jgi:hypothetical protein
VRGLDEGQSRVTAPRRLRWIGAGWPAPGAAGRLWVLAIYTRRGTLPARVNTNRIAL